MYDELYWLEICHMENQELELTEISNRERGCKAVNWIQNRV
jgi:hypothetical protein